MFCWEVSTRVARAGGRNGGAVDRLVEELGVSVVPFGAAEWPIAVEAFRRFGRGRHPAALTGAAGVQHGLDLGEAQALLEDRLATVRPDAVVRAVPDGSAPAPSRSG